MRKTIVLPDKLKINFQDYCDGCQMPEFRANIHNDSNGLSSLFCVHSERCFKISQNLKRFYGIDEEDINAVWVKISPAGIYECSNCKKNVMTSDIEAYERCHGCGAHMRLEEEK